MAQGKVKVWLEDRGFGFITEDGGDDVFVHAKSLPPGMRQLSPGTRVLFAKRRTQRGMQAVDVELATMATAGPDVLTESEFARELVSYMESSSDTASALLDMARYHGWVG